MENERYLTLKETADIPGSALNSPSVGTGRQDSGCES